MSDDRTGLTIAVAARATDEPLKPYEVHDKGKAGVMGLLVRVQPSGRRTYYVDVSRGRRIRIGRADAFTLDQARERAGEFIRDPDSAPTQARTGITLLEYIDQHFEQDAVAKTKTGKATVARAKAQWPALIAKRLDSITQAEVDRLRNKRIAAGRAPATVNRDTDALRAVFTHWAKHTKGAKHPLKGMSNLKAPKDEKIRYLTPEEDARLRKALAERDLNKAESRESFNQWRKEHGKEALPEVAGFSDHLTPMVLLSLNTGLRRGELFKMQWEHIDMKLKTLTVLASNAKGNSTRVIPLNAEAMQVLKAIRPKDAKWLVFPSPIMDKNGEPRLDDKGRPKGFDNVQNAWTELTTAAKLTGFRWHDMRHNFASWLVMKGVPIFTVQKLLGHASPAMTQRYARLAPRALADAVELLGS